MHDNGQGIVYRLTPASVSLIMSVGMVIGGCAAMAG
jgi:hypothetical protein